jgi:hypothetical protein
VRAIIVEDGKQVRSMNQFRSELEKGVIITLDPGRARMRILPLKGFEANE